MEPFRKPTTPRNVSQYCVDIARRRDKGSRRKLVQVSTGMEAGRHSRVKRLWSRLCRFGLGNWLAVLVVIILTAVVLIIMRTY